MYGIYGFPVQRRNQETSLHHMLCPHPLQEERPKQNKKEGSVKHITFPIFTVGFYLFFFLILRSDSILFLSFTFKLKAIEFPTSYLNVTMFHDGQKNVSHYFLTVDCNFCSEALTSVMKNVNHSNSQRCRAREVAITLFRQRKLAEAIISQEQNLKSSLQFVHLIEVCGENPSNKKSDHSTISLFCPVPVTGAGRGNTGLPQQTLQEAELGTVRHGCLHKVRSFLHEAVSSKLKVGNSSRNFNFPPFCC